MSIADASPRKTVFYICQVVLNLCVVDSFVRLFCMINERPPTKSSPSKNIKFKNFLLTKAWFIVSENSQCTLREATLLDMGLTLQYGFTHVFPVELIAHRVNLVNWKECCYSNVVRCIDFLRELLPCFDKSKI